MITGRCEYKFLLNADETRVIRRLISENISPDSNSGDKGYVISSLYFDDTEHKLYYQTHNREPFRYKLRLRVYGETQSDDSISFFEIKSKCNGRSQKKRLSLPLAENELLWREKKIPARISPSEANIAHDILYLIKTDRLLPASIVSYKRLAFAAPGIEKLRVTFDSELSIRTERLDLRLGIDGISVMPEGFCVMECKSYANLPLWLVRIISEYRLANRSYSKYGQTQFAEIENKKNYYIQGEPTWATYSAAYSKI